MINSVNCAIILYFFYILSNKKFRLPFNGGGARFFFCFVFFCSCVFHFCSCSFGFLICMPSFNVIELWLCGPPYKPVDLCIFLINFFKQSQKLYNSLNYNAKLTQHSHSALPWLYKVHTLHFIYSSFMTTDIYFVNCCII